ncbi:MAG: response regulator [Magnetovibrionaceae bacterium]
MRSYDLSGLKFLVVDNNAHMRQIVYTILHGFGVDSIFQAEDGGDALRQARWCRPDIIIVDNLMEPVDGLEMTRTLRRDPNFFDPFVPVIMLSGLTEPQNVAAARDAGVTEFCAKPVSATTLYSHIVSCIENPRAFVRAPGYVGPDRKRHDPTDYQGPERRGSDGC